MTMSRVLIVEDDPLIALDVEQTLQAAGFEVCGVASSEAEALEMAARLHPELAIVDISLNPGDGRAVARALNGSTAVLFATGQSDEVADMRATGALACLPKPYSANVVPRALEALARMAEGEDAAPLPDHMFALRAA